MIAVMAFGRAVPRLAWYMLAAAGVLLMMWRWHVHGVDVARADGARVQAVVDGAQFAAATALATRAQHDLAAVLAARQSRISKGSDDALVARNADLARRYDDLRLRWAAYRADPGGSGPDRATGVPGTAAGVDDAACAASGWVSFDTAAAAAQAADTAIAKDDAWIAWATAQAAAWPR